MKVGDPYVCERCREQFTAVTSEEEAVAEATEIFGAPIPVEERAILCDPCHKEFMVWFEQLSPADHEAIRAGRYEGKMP